MCVLIAPKVPVFKRLSKVKSMKKDRMSVTLKFCQSSVFTNILPRRRYRSSRDIMEVLLFKELFKNLGYSSLYTLRTIE